MEEKKTEGQLMNEKLSYKFSNAWEKVSDEERLKALDFCEGYKAFLDKAKTEREFVKEAETVLLKNGFVALEEAVALKGRLTPGTKVYKVIRNKCIMAAVIGKRNPEDGMNVIGAHIDSPRLDLKQCPLYEDTDMALFKTHYYGGIKKYQWLAIPLALHGVVVKESGETVNICIGEKPEDTVFTITDLLPHLAVDQMQKKVTEAFTGEGLNLLAGSIPYHDEKVKDKVKLNILKLLHEEYGLKEEDFVSAELEIVPAFKARDVGLDRSMVGAYGQDDRSCAYTALKALTDMDSPEKTTLCLLVDKEEIGSMGNTGAKSRLFENFVALLCQYTHSSYQELMLIKSLENSKMLSADVNAAVDPNYEGVQDKRNASYAGKGIILQKYTGARGKVDASDANAEYLGEMRRLFNGNGILWQTGEMGKVDKGGGGTIAQYMANLGMDVIDCGVAVLSMHAPFEITSKIDIYMAYKAYKAFYEKMP